jgi:DNA-binding NtrC family response regulator
MGSRSSAGKQRAPAPIGPDAAPEESEDLADDPRRPLAIWGGSARSGRCCVVPVDGQLIIGSLPGDGRGWLGIPDDPTLSREHVAIVEGDGVFEIHNLAGRNPPCVNGTIVTSFTCATSGALVLVGHQAFVLRFVSKEAHSAIEEDLVEPLTHGPTLNPGLAMLHRRLRAEAPSHGPLLFWGRPGTGRLTHGAAVHRLSLRSGPFIEVPASVLDSEAAEATLFGKASEDRTGLVAQAEGGTLFVHAIHRASSHVQRKLARLIWQRRHGCACQSGQRASDVRIIGSTDRRQAWPDARGHFLRPELAEAFGDAVFELPALVDRKEDIGAIVRDVFHGRPGVLSTSEWRALWLHDWPGNISELRTRLGATALGPANAAVGDEHLAVETRLPPGLRGRRTAEAIFELGPTSPELVADRQSVSAAGRLCARPPITFEGAAAELGRRNGGLARRQIEVAARLAEGKTCKTIATELGLDYRTVSEHIARACRAIGVRNREELSGRVAALLLEMANGPK